MDADLTEQCIVFAFAALPIVQNFEEIHLRMQKDYAARQSHSQQ